MTCIVGLVHDGKVYMGGDSAGVGGLDLTIRADKKVFRNGDFLMGFTTSFRMGQLLQYSFRPPQRYPDRDVMAFMVTDFIEAVRNCLRAGGFASKREEAEQGGTFLVGYQGRLFKIDSDYQVGEAAAGYDSCGCGESFAIGAFYASQGVAPDERILLALRAAEANSAGVAAPFTTHVLE